MQLICWTAMAVLWWSLWPLVSWSLMVLMTDVIGTGMKVPLQQMKLYIQLVVT